MRARNDDGTRDDGGGSWRKRYLFIRILEACNADCFMCEYARSVDQYRFTIDEFQQILSQALPLGVGFVRFTGGEPLMHREIEALVRSACEVGIKTSIITNGSALRRQAERLANAGLSQVIVSIDGASAAAHDSIRNTPGLFERCLSGLAKCGELGVDLRVNSVVGPQNYDEMPALQQLLGELKVQQWELSALKLERPIVYPNPRRVVSVCEPLYDRGAAVGPVPMGKRFYGETSEEQMQFFSLGVTPRASPPACHLVGDVIYLDARAGVGFGCSLLPHRDTDASGGGVRLRGKHGWQLNALGFAEHVATFRECGPTTCRGCSTTAAGYSDRVAASAQIRDWEF